ncbi:MAG: class I SAM-dependent methyltransferase [Roseimicrobium sp.]
MRMALYEPGLGYYRRGVRRIGRGGDFFTSVIVGPLFGHLLAAYAHGLWTRLGKPPHFTVLEQGAHDGTLARDVLEACATNWPDFFFQALQYDIIEPDAALCAAQRVHVGKAYEDKLCHRAAGWSPSTTGLFVCNELLDAFPVHRVRWNGTAWRELWVYEDAAAPDAFAFTDGELSMPELANALREHGPGLPVGYTTEVCLEAETWIRECAQMDFCGVVLLLDYGFTTAEHFAAERPNGTLRRYHAHRTDDAVFANLGEADLTAHVDFTRVAQTAEAAGMQVVEFVEQGRFLTRLFAEHFATRGKVPDATTVRQFQTLTHPSQMGRVFQVLAVAKGIPATLLSTPESTRAARERLGLHDSAARSEPPPTPFVHGTTD